MSKIGLIIKREIKSKLSNKTFLIMTFLAPILITGFFGFIIKMSMDDKTQQKVLVVDDTKHTTQLLQGNDYITFVNTNLKLDEAIDKLVKEDYTCVLNIFENTVGGGAGAVELFYKKSPGLFFQENIKNQLEKIFQEEKLKANNIDPNIINNTRESIKLITQKVDENGFKKDDSNLGFLGFLVGALMFMFIMLYGMMVFRSVMEEKTNRIIEVIVSSVKPFELMMGKIIGVALLGLIQFIIMGVISIILTTLLSTLFLKDINKEFSKFNSQQELVKKMGTNVNFNQLEDYQDKIEVFDLLKKIDALPIQLIVICFILYFIGGYLFYSSLMAAIGSAVDSEADSQQFITPVMIPLMAGYFIAVKSMTNPDSAIAYWASFIPFTSPIVMMSRLNVNTPVWELLLSLGLLYASFIFMAYIAAKIYRTGILMYGKKVSWKEVGKWLFYK